MADQLQPDWPLQIVRRQTTTIETKVPEFCQECGSSRLFLGSGNAKCGDCHTVTRFVAVIKDLNAENDVYEEFNDKMTDAKGERALLRES